jgi:hypothetical protein
LATDDTVQRGPCPFGRVGQEARALHWEPSPQQIARTRADTDVLLAHLIRPTTRYRRDIQALRAAPPRIVIAVGTTSKGQLANRTAAALTG